MYCWSVSLRRSLNKLFVFSSQSPNLIILVLDFPVFVTIVLILIRFVPAVFMNETAEPVLFQLDEILVPPD